MDYCYEAKLISDELQCVSASIDSLNGESAYEIACKLFRNTQQRKLQAKFISKADLYLLIDSLPTISFFVITEPNKQREIEYPKKDILRLMVDKMNVPAQIFIATMESLNGSVYSIYSYYEFAIKEDNYPIERSVC